jgi:AhpD family alkylhydroperoxidase
MQQRIDATTVSPAGYRAVAALQTYVDQSGLVPKLRELIKIRVSQINGCAFCLIMHTRDARKLGASDDRMHLLDAWREAPVFTARERAALAWTEALTLVSKTHVPDDVYAEVRRHCLREGNRRPHRRGGGHQQLEPDCDCIPHAAAGRERESGGLAHDPEKLVLDLIGDGNRFSEKIMRKRI